MLKTVRISQNSKTGPIATTYRAGHRSTYGTCPKSCGLHPAPETGTETIDAVYLDALLDAVPPRGQAWTYSHFPASLLPRPEPGKTVVNVSTDTMDAAVDALESGRPSVVAAPAGTEWRQVTYRGTRFIRCPAEMSDNFTCMQCGNGRPLCARPERDYVIVFVAHGPGAKKVGYDTPGGCYASTGHASIAWHGTRKTGAPNDAETVRNFARSLPPGSLLRHHIAGDLGAEI